MSDALPALTLFIGPSSQHGLALNATVRASRPMLEKVGVTAYPLRLAGPAIWAVGDRGRAVEDRQSDFDRILGEAPAFYCALGLLSVAKDFGSGQLFPSVDQGLQALAEVAGKADLRFVVAIDTLPDLFLSQNSAVLDARVANSDWAVLYELSWVQPIRAIRQSFPDAEIAVLTHAGAVLNSDTMLRHLFGSFSHLVGPRIMLQSALNTTGQAVLDRMGNDVAWDEEIARELYQSFASRAGADECRTRLGMDRLTLKLLLQRFDEDLTAIAAMADVTVI